MNKRLLAFFPHNPWLPKSGAHRRVLEVLAGLNSLGCEVTLLSSRLSSDTKWDEASIQALKDSGVADVRVYDTNAVDYASVMFTSKCYQLAKMSPPLASVVYSPHGMRRWFTKIVDEIAPDVVLMNYAYWDRLLDHDHLDSALTIIDTLDVVSLNTQMRRRLHPYLVGPLVNGTDVDECVVQEDFFNRLNLAPDPKELQTFDRYDCTIAISAREADLIKRHTHRTKVALIPVTMEPCYITNQYAGAALFPIGANPFNTQGYLYFVERVLPLVQQQAPSFSLQVTGSWYMRWRPKRQHGIELSGFIPDLQAVYATARFVVCPVFGGTGQQIKIVEAMAHGLPVIALSAAAENSPIQHGVNGLVASNAKEFAACVIELWNDAELCRRLGEAARITIAKEYSRAQLVDALASIIGAQPHPVAPLSEASEVEKGAAH